MIYYIREDDKAATPYLEKAVSRLWIPKAMLGALYFRKKNFDKMREILRAEIEKHFRPEFLNRLDEVIFFRTLARADLVEIVDIEVGRVRERLAQRGMTLELTADAKEFIIDKGYNPDFGARPLRRAIENLIEDPLSEEILRGSFDGKDGVVVCLKDDHLFFDTQEHESVEEPATAGSK